MHVCKMVTRRDTGMRLETSYSISAPIENAWMLSRVVGLYGNLHEQYVQEVAQTVAPL